MQSLWYLANTAKAFVSYHLGREVVSHYTLEVWIEPTSVCNFKCIMCPNPELTKSQLGHMTMERFKRIVDDVSPYVGSVSICHRGEPLAHKKIFDMIAYATERGMRTSAHTNASYLNPDVSRRLIESGLPSFMSAASQIRLKPAKPGTYLD